MEEDGDFNLVIPQAYQRQNVWEEYKRVKMLGGEPFVASSTFLKMWKSLYKNIRLADTASSFAKCDMCERIRNKLTSSTTLAQITEIKEQRSQHVAFQAAERGVYRRHRVKAKSKPNQYLSIIMDGMDQMKTSLPVLPTMSKTQSALPLLKQKVHGVLVHGIGTYLYTAVHPLVHGGNFSVECLWRTLVAVSKRRMEMGLLELPPVFYLQLDNCRDGKNKTLFMYCHYLVLTGVFKKVAVCVNHAYLGSYY